MVLRQLLPGQCYPHTHRAEHSDSIPDVDLYVAFVQPVAHFR